MTTEESEIDVEAANARLVAKGITGNSPAPKPRRTRSDKGTTREKAPGVLNEAQAAHLDSLVEAHRVAQEQHAKSTSVMLEAKRAYYAYLDELQGKSAK